MKNAKFLPGKRTARGRSKKMTKTDSTRPSRRA